MARHDHAYIAETLAQVAERRSDEEARLQHGLRLREEMHHALEAGSDYKGYRLDWVQKSAKLLVDLLEDIGEDFNKGHPDDRASIYDLLDILYSAQGIIRRAIGPQPGQPDQE